MRYGPVVQAIGADSYTTTQSLQGLHLGWFAVDKVGASESALLL